jgi:hypothetical protein
MTWSKGHSDKAVCISCNLKTSKKPSELCKEKKHLEYYNNRRKRNNEYRKEKRKIDPYYATGFDKESWKKYSREKIRKTRACIVEKLGNKCISCGYTDIRALQIDHINGGGGSERKIYGWKYFKYLNELKNLSDYQLLCSNCHSIKSYNEKYIN